MKFFAFIVLVLALFAALAQNVAAGKGKGAAATGETPTYVAAPVTYVAAPVKPPKAPKVATPYVAAPVTYVAAPVKPAKVPKAPKQAVYTSQAGDAGAAYGKAAKAPKYAN